MSDHIDDMVMGILLKYSNPEKDQTICRMSELKRDFTSLLRSIEREKQRVEDLYTAWLRVQQDLYGHKPRVFDRLRGRL